MWRVAPWLLLAVLFARGADSGERLFRIHCAPCHGPDGSGGRGPSLAVRVLPHAPDDAAISRIITLGLPGTQMPGTRMTADENRELTAFVRSLYHGQTAQVDGDAANGERLFRSKAGCIQCHTVGGGGGRLGPDLSDIGSRRGPEYLRATLLDPAATIPDTFTVYRRVIYMPDHFLQVRAVTQNGNTITGARINEDAFTIQIRDSADRLYSLRKDELRELHKDWGKTPMPSYRSLPDAEMRDLIAYLVSLKGTQ
jgi:putative heme-binding domain-containing protein